MLKKLALTDKGVAIICSAAELGGITAFGVACGIMYNAQTFLSGPAGAALAGVVAYILAVWIHTGANDRLAGEADYADGYNAARRKLIEAGWRQATTPETVESILPDELLTDMEALMIDHEEAIRAHQAAIDRGTSVKRALLGVNACVVELKAELAQAQIRADRAEGALQDIQDVHKRYSFGPVRMAPAPEPAPAATPAPSAVPIITMEHIQAATPLATRNVLLQSTTAGRLPLAARIHLSPPDDGEPSPTFLHEPRDIPVDLRGTKDALMRLEAIASHARPAAAGNGT